MDNVFPISVTIPGDPVAYQRARVKLSHGRWYKPKLMREYQEVALTYLRSQCPGDPDSTSIFAIQMTFYRHNHQRIDLDNLVKTIIDSATMAHIWRDDSQVRELGAKLYLGDSTPRVEVRISKIGLLNPAREQVYPIATGKYSGR